MSGSCAWTKLSFSPRKRRTNALRLRPPILLILVSFVGIVVPLFCASLKNADTFSLPLPRKNDGQNSQRHGFCADQNTLTKTPLFSSLSPCNVPHQDDQALPSASLFPTHRPILAIITETDACDTEEKMRHTYTVVKKAASTDSVDLVSVRLSLPPRYDENGNENYSYRQISERACRLTKKLVDLSLEKSQQLRSQENEDKEDDENGASKQLQSSCSFMVVCSSDLVSVAVKARANGVHVKEHHLDQLPDIVRRFDYPIVIGTSTHSVESALRSFSCNNDSNDSVQNENKDEFTTRAKFTRPIPHYLPHYYFVGTCYMTASHPEKKLQSQLEGPGLPGRVKRALLENFQSKQQRTISTTEDSDDASLIEALQLRLPRIMAIGGIDESNCHEPVELGADGVAVIRAILQADHPIERVEEMQNNMMRSFRTVNE